MEAMSEDPDSLVRQAAAFGLGELGGAASASRLEHSLPLRKPGVITMGMLSWGTSSGRGTH